MTDLRAIDLTGFDPLPPLDDPRPVALDWVPVDRLRFDPRYQREIEKRGRQTIEKIAKHFDWARFQPLMVARAPGDLFAVLDGQHRAHAAALRGFPKVPALVSSLSPREQAQAFSWINGTVTALTPVQVYRAALAGGEAWAIAARDAVEAAGCQLMVYNASAANKRPGQVFCVTAVRAQIDLGRAAQVTAWLAGLRQSALAEFVPWYGQVGFQSVVPELARYRVTRADVVAGFLAAHDLRDVSSRVYRLLEQDDYRGQTHRALFAESVAVLLKAWLRQNGVTPAAGRAA